MSRIGSRLGVALVVVTIGLFGAGVPAHGEGDGLDDSVQWAKNQNQVILAEFTNAALSACSMAKLDSARATADSKLDAVRNAANRHIAFLVKANPTLESAATAARARLDIDHEAAHAEVAASYASAAGAMSPCATTTTTATTPWTTSTTSPTTTTTTTPHPTPTSTTTTTTEPPTTTTTTHPMAVFLGEPPARQGGTAIGYVGPAVANPAMAHPVIAEDHAMTSALLFDSNGIVTNDGTGDGVAEAMAQTGTISGMVTSGASVVLPPGLVRKAVGPIIAVEFLVLTLIESLGTMIVPLAVFLMAAGFIVWRESRRPSPIVRVTLPPM